MTLDERAFLQAAGNLLAQYLLILSIDALFFGFFIALWILAYLSLLDRGKLGNSWAIRAQLAALLLNFLTSVVYLIQNMAYFIILAVHLNSWQAPGVVNAKMASFGIAADWISQIGLLINDIVVIWRAWVLYRDRPIVLFSLCLTFCATLATNFGYLALITQISSFLGSAGGASSSGFSTRSTTAYTLGNVVTVLSLTTNLLATSLILFQLWRHSRFIGRSGLPRNSLTSSQRIMLFLVEAGFIFCIGQAFDMFLGFYLNAADKNITLVANFVFNVIDNMFWASLPMYLPVVILLAANNRTIHEYVSYDSNILREAVDVEAMGYQEEGPAESRTASEHLGTAQLQSAHEDSGNH